MPLLLRLPLLLLLIISPLNALLSPQRQRHQPQMQMQMRCGWTNEKNSRWCLSKDARIPTSRSSNISRRLSVRNSKRENRKASGLFRLEMGLNKNYDDGDDDAEREYEYDYKRIDDEDDDTSFGGNTDDNDGNSKRKLIEISSQIELPFSAKVAYEAYSDLPRQPSWSSWLKSVVVLEDGNNNSKKVESRWTSKVMGIRYSWTAEAVKNERPHTIQWRSVTGLRNEGTVRFYAKEGKSYDQGPTLMTLRMAFVIPRALTSIIRSSKKLSNFVEEKMIAQSLKEFRDIVLEEDVKNAVELKTKSPTL